MDSYRKFLHYGASYGQLQKVSLYGATYEELDDVPSLQSQLWRTTE